MSSEFPKRLEASITSSDWRLIGDSLRELWPSICAAARAYLEYFPRRASAADRLRVYLRPDTGGVYFAVCPCPPRAHYGEVACIYLRQLESEYFELPRSDNGFDGFERGHCSLMLRLVAAIKKSCTHELSPLALTVVEYDDLETERPLNEIDCEPA